MGKIVLVLGGARSGKSRTAQTMAEASDGRLIYVATAQALDAEMSERISRHQSDRSMRWETVECPVRLADVLKDYHVEGMTILIDCLTLWLSNLILGEHHVEQAVTGLKAAVAASPCHIIMVSNEVGQGIVPENPLARRFRDEAGWLNQAIAGIAEEVWFVTAGVPQRLK